MMEWITSYFQPGVLFAPVCLALLIGLPLIWWPHWRRKQRAIVRFGSLAGFVKPRAGLAAHTWFLQPLLRTLVVLALIFALARPQSGGRVSDLREGIAVQMVIDVSGSMQVEDFELNGKPARRIDAVKRVFRDFVLGSSGLPGRENDLIGMTTFAMYADNRAPLTLDHANLINLLEDTDIPGYVNGRQVRPNREAEYTSLGDAIVLATDELRQAGEQAISGIPGAQAAKSRVMILLTDGKNNPPDQDRNLSPDPKEAAKVAADLGIRIYTIGAVGSAIRRRHLPFRQRRQAGVDEPTMRAIAQTTGGQYFRASDTESLRKIYEEIDQLERRQTGERSYRDNTRALFFSTLAGIGLLMLEVFLTNTRWRRVP